MQVKMTVWVVLLLMAGIAFQKGHANFNLFLSKAEVKRILGLNAELYYIREGVVNDYAMKFSVKVPPEIHSIFFRWEALTKKPVLYNMMVWINETSLKDGESPIREPSLNISTNGIIPRDTDTFQLNLPCTGLMDGQVEVILNLNVTSPRPNQPPTVLYFNRKKICLKGIAAEKLLPRKSLQEEPPLETETTTESEKEDGIPLFVYILYGIASLGLVIAIITAVACWKAFDKMRKYPFPTIHQPVFVASTPNERKSTASLQKSSTSQLNNVYTSPSGLYTGPSAVYTGPSGTYTLPSALTGNSYASVYKFPFQSTDITAGGSIPRCKCTDSSCSGIYESSWYSNSNSKSESYLSSRNSRDEDKCHLKCKYDKCCADKRSGFRLDVSHIKDRFRQLQMDRERVRLTEVMQEGKKGRIYKGWLQREHPELDQQVLVKTLREASPPSDVSSFCVEGTLLAGLRHQNLMSLVGVSFATSAPPFLIFPDPQGRNFKIFLKTSPLPLKVVELMEVCLQAAKALCFMHANHILHNDIAARNCVISDHLQLRLTDSALSRDFFPEDYEAPSEGSATPSPPSQGTPPPPPPPPPCCHPPPGSSSSSSGGQGEGEGREEDLLPLRWMAPEALQEQDQVSAASDVWSLGVLLWEASTQGERPYSCVPPAVLSAHLQEGHRLRQSPVCPDDIFCLMTACWSDNPLQRPSAHQVIDFLTAFRQSLNNDFV